MVKSKPIHNSNSSEVGAKKRSKDILKSDIEVNLMNGIPLSKICSSQEFPSLTTVYEWMSKDSKFKDSITQARMNGALTNLDKGFEEMEKLTTTKDKTHLDITLLNTKLTHLRWIASKILPQYNDKVVNEHKGDISFKIGWDDGKDPLLNQPKKL
mgnify:CR=1 FL=1